MSDAIETPRRSFLMHMGAGMCVVGTGAAAWPLAASLGPDAATRAALTPGMRVDISDIPEGWRVLLWAFGEPIIIAHRTPAEIAAARAGDGSADLFYPEADADRVQDPRWLVLRGYCNNGWKRIVSGWDELRDWPFWRMRPQLKRGDYGGWWCGYRNSHFDTSGRLVRRARSGNMTVPTYRFVGPQAIEIPSPSGLRIMRQRAVGVRGL